LIAPYVALTNGITTPEVGISGGEENGLSGRRTK